VVSRQPAIRRNLPVAVAADLTAEVGDRVRTALGEQAEQVEEVALISETGFEELAEPPAPGHRRADREVALN
jgi:phenylalanyl-tRNA synthetase alpha chain